MKFRIALAVLLVVVLGGLATLTNESGPTSTALPAPASADDAAMKSFNLN